MTCFTSIYSQNENNNWLFGFKDTLHGEICGTYLWHDDSVSVSFSEINTELNFEATMAAISDTAGKLLLYTNGCSIADSTHKTILNGGDLNPGEVHDQVCKKIGYIVPNGAMFIPWPGINNKFILLHHGIYQDSYGIYINGPFYYTVIDQINGEYIVTEKNNTIINSKMESFAVIRHGNGIDWWIIVPGPNSSRYFTFLFTKNGISEYPVQETGFAFPDIFCKVSGLSGFSPDGNKYLRFNNSCGYLLFDFDRCSGLLSGCIYEPVGHFVDDVSADFAFSHDSRYLFINKLDHHRFSDSYFINKLYRVDIEQIGKKASPYLEYELPFFFRFNRFLVTNKKQIFVIHPYSSEKITLLNNSDETDALELEVFKLHSANARTIPYFANFTLRKNDCNMVNSVEITNELLTLYPNPIIKEVNIDLSGSNEISQLIVMDVTGSKLFSKTLYPYPQIVSIDMDNFNSGLYIFEIRNNKKIQILKAIKL